MKKITVIIAFLCFGAIAIFGQTRNNVIRSTDGNLYRYEITYQGIPYVIEAEENNFEDYSDEDFFEYIAILEDKDLKRK